MIRKTLLFRFAPFHRMEEKQKRNKSNPIPLNKINYEPF